MIVCACPAPHIDLRGALHAHCCGAITFQSWATLCCMQVTAVLYTSTGWQQQNGGMLRLWQPPGTHRDGSAQEIDVEPLGGRLVLFLSGAVDHAVQPSQAARVALTAWMT